MTKYLGFRNSLNWNSYGFQFYRDDEWSFREFVDAVQASKAWAEETHVYSFDLS